MPNRQYNVKGRLISVQARQQPCKAKMGETGGLETRIYVKVMDVPAFAGFQVPPARQANGRVLTLRRTPADTCGQEEDGGQSNNLMHRRRRRND